MATRVGEMARLIRPLADFQRVPAPSTWQLRHVTNFSSRGSDISFWSWGAPGTSDRHADEIFILKI